MMDQVDRKLLRLLSVNARQSITSLAGEMGLARTTLQARLERLERTGVIAGYSLKLGDQTQKQKIRATVLLQLDPRSAAGVVQRLKKMEVVERAHTTSGRFDLILQLATQDTTQMDDILDAIGIVPGVRTSESLIHLSVKIDREM